jgi:hypothetical protein
MKSPDAAELYPAGANSGMVKGGGESGTGMDRRLRSTRISRIPIEWMDPMSWRLPSGKDLAEFALQSGFLAPMMLERPNLKRKRALAPAPAGPVVVERQAGEVPEHSGSFRGIR